MRSLVFADILSGSVGILNNYNLCHVKTIQWNEIITSPTAKYRYEYRFREAERECTPCHESCEAGCWGEGPHNCQKFSKISCRCGCLLVYTITNVAVKLNGTVSPLQFAIDK